MNVGDIVYNKFFGRGIIVEINQSSACIKFESLQTNRTLRIGYFIY